jgi:D-cysteine desulfhydrase
MEFHYPPSISLANLPTPIQKLERLSDAWGGPEIYIKRDDLTGFGLSGNKVRKLEFSVAAALEQGADTVITCGGIQSNHARATAVAAARVGLRSFLVLRGDGRSRSEGNLFLDRLLGCEFRFITPEEYEGVDAMMSDISDMLRKKGRKAYVIPEGASNEIGYFGYIRAAEEISIQLKEMDLAVDFIVTATGSGGTLGGLLLGKKFFGLQAQPVGINVCDTADYFQERIHGVIMRMVSKFGWEVKIPKKDIVLIDGYVGEGYALSTDEELRLITDVARMEGIFIDPVYTGKTLFGLRDLIRKGRFTKGQKILFLHSGGVFGMFPMVEAFERVWK